MNGCVGVPLHATHSDADIDYLLADSSASLFLLHTSYAQRVNSLSSTHTLPVLELQNACTLEIIDEPDTAVLQALKCSSNQSQASQIIKQLQAMLIYTSGTTGKVCFPLWRLLCFHVRYSLY